MQCSAGSVLSKGEDRDALSERKSVSKKKKKKEANSTMLQGVNWIGEQPAVCPGSRCDTALSIRAGYRI